MAILWGVRNGRDIISGCCCRDDEARWGDVLSMTEEGWVGSDVGCILNKECVGNGDAGIRGVD